MFKRFGKKIMLLLKKSWKKLKDLLLRADIDKKNSDIIIKSIIKLQEKVDIKNQNARDIWEMINIICKYLGEETTTNNELYVNYICEDDKIKIVMKIGLKADISALFSNLCYIKVDKSYYELVFEKKAGEDFIEYKTGRWEECIKSLYSKAIKIDAKKELDDLNLKLKTVSNEADKIFK